MTEAVVRPKLAAWSGWVIAAVFLVTPIMAWLGQRGFAPLVAAAGLLTLPGFRIREADRPAAIAVLVIVIWAVGSSVWSLYTPNKIGESAAVKLVAEAVLYGSAIVAARQAPDAPRLWILRFLVWGLVALSVVMMVETVTGAGLYRALRDATHDPIRPDLGVRNVARALFILSLFAPAAIVAAARVGGGVWLGIPLVIGIVWPSIVFSYDAPLVALVASAGAMGLVMTFPRWGPRILATVAALGFLSAPFVVWGTRQVGLFDKVQANVSLSWSQRMGYWRHAQDWTFDHPLRGWGLDSSRMFSPGIRLHPHDAALQIWLELGLIGAVAAAVLWVAILAGMRRDRPDWAVAASAGCALAYLTFNAFSFGVWQEWWLALGALACCACAALQRQPARR